MNKDQLVYELHTLATEVQHSDMTMEDATTMIERLLTRLKKKNIEAVHGDRQDGE